MCGMTRNEDVSRAVSLGVDAIGLVFYSPSPRNVSIQQAELVLKNLPPFIDVVAVLVNPEKSYVRSILEVLPVNLLQFHGDESPEFCQEFDFPFIKATHATSTRQIVDLAEQFDSANALLLDTASPLYRGGTGLTFDWSIIPDTLTKPYILAGGLNESNIGQAIRQHKPYAVDVCSGIESSPGVKDHHKMSLFIKALEANNEY
ncbi:phosphoribosylanthranilate isomerase [Legionella worsleiensis]|uniref:N-(5'-phosphoribosyl)anthranilate isomerase n=2 Tax=Legionella worsleiensis TaxID=45076 RepID=A0A0W1AL60_9GAMM|nr:N-(5'-phosphoribosyl)anthranilate isomerase [Legionella worsleiensis]STY30336.1 phosphoribosyl anthranilate isomerase [Legionella worsleiensis]